MDIMVARSRVGWDTWNFDILGADDSFLYLWDFGDGKFSQEKAPEHSFGRAGKYMVELSVSDGLGGIGKVASEIRISFWHIGNPIIKGMLALLGLFALTMAILLIFNLIPALQKSK